MRSYYWTDSVFVKLLLHISGSWLIRVRLVHSWAGLEDAKKIESIQRNFRLWDELEKNQGARQRSGTVFWVLRD